MTETTQEDFQRKLLGAVRHAVKFMKHSGYDKFEHCEPEYQMWKSLVDVLQLSPEKPEPIMPPDRRMANYLNGGKTWDNVPKDDPLYNPFGQDAVLKSYRDERGELRWLIFKDQNAFDVFYLNGGMR